MMRDQKAKAFWQTGLRKKKRPSQKAGFFIEKKRFSTGIYEMLPKYFWSFESDIFISIYPGRNTAPREFLTGLRNL